MRQLPNPESLEQQALQAARREFERRNAYRKTCEASLHEFIKEAWHVVEPATVFKSGWHLEAICEHLQAVSCGQIRDLVINIPPRFAKSLTVAVFWPAWEWTFSPEKRWMFASYGEKLSLRDSVKCRRLIQSPWYQKNWAKSFQLTSDQNAKERFENDKTGFRIATSVTGLGTGEGGDRIVVDDPHNVEEVESDTVRNTVLEWWDGTMSTRGNDPETVARVIVMQRLHHEDLAGHVLAKGGYEHLCLPMRYEGSEHITSIGFSDPREKVGELLWPERFSEEAVQRLERELGSYKAAGQLQQRPTPEGGGIFKESWFQYFNKVDLPAYDKLYMVQSWDLAFKDSDGSDYVVGLLLAKYKANIYILDRVKDRMDYPATKRAIKALSQKWPHAHAKFIEDKANGPAVISELKNELPGLIAVQPEGGKISRAHAASPIVESGNVFLPVPEEASWVEDFIMNLCGFPNMPHDDDVDAFSQGVVRLNKIGGGIWAFYENEATKEQDKKVA